MLNHLLKWFYTILHTFQQCISVPVSPHPHQHLVLLDFDYSRLSGCVVEFHCGFNSHFPNN